MSIDDAIDQMSTIIAAAQQQRARQGIFAALYRRVTMAVRDGIAAGRFADGERMAAFDVIFAKRYLDAYTQYQNGGPCSKSWAVAFDACDKPDFLILQHLLLGMNAHINLDLGIAAAEAAPGSELAALEADFLEINHLLAELVQDVQRQIAAVSPWLGVLDLVGGRSDESIINFNLSKARASAWDLAMKLAALPPDEQAATIARRDQAVADFAAFVMRPGLTIGAAIFFIWLRELRDPAAVIEHLSR